MDIGGRLWPTCLPASHQIFSTLLDSHSLLMLEGAFTEARSMDGLCAHILHELVKVTRFQRRTGLLGSFVLQLIRNYVNDCVFVTT